MQQRFRSLAVLIAVLPVALSARQADSVKTLTGDIVVATSEGRRTTAVLGKKTGGGAAEFLFCIDHGKPVPQKIEFTGPGRVLYRPGPTLSLPAGVSVSGPEQILPTLAVVPSAGKALVFVGKGEKPPLASSDPAAKEATTINVSGISRTDWEVRPGARRGTDLEGCLAPGG